MKSKPATMNHTISKKGSLKEFEKWFKKKYGVMPNMFWQPLFSLGEVYDIKKTVAREAWLARELVY